MGDAVAVAVAVAVARTLVLERARVENGRATRRRARLGLGRIVTRRGWMRAAPGVFSGWASGAGTDAWWGRRARASSSSSSASSASRARVVARG